MDETFDAIANLHEATKWNEFCHATINELTNLVTTGKFLPWILLRGLERKTDAFTVHVNFENLDSYFIANRDDRAWIVNMLP